MNRDFHFDTVGLIQRVAGEHPLDPMDEEEAHRLGEPWKPRRRFRHRHSWADEQVEEGTGI